MWIFLYGDNPWPAMAEQTLMALSVVVFASILATLLSALFAFGKKQELRGGLSKKHVLIAALATIVLPALIVLRQWSIGEIGSHDPYAVPAATVGNG